MVPQEMGRVVINLLSNAFNAIREHAASMNGQYEPTVCVSSCRKENAVEIRVEDNGPGLSMSYDIITQGHGVSLAVESEPGAGMAFLGVLPV